MSSPSRQNRTLLPLLPAVALLTLLGAGTVRGAEAPAAQEPEAAPEVQEGHQPLRLRHHLRHDEPGLHRFRHYQEDLRHLRRHLEELPEIIGDSIEEGLGVLRDLDLPEVRVHIWPRGSRIAHRALLHAEELGLSEAQRESIREARMAERRQRIEREARIKIAKLELEELLRDEGSDLAAIEAKMRELAELRIQDRMAALRLDRTIRDILTPEQLQELKELRRHRVRFRSRAQGRR